MSVVKAMNCEEALDLKRNSKVHQSIMQICPCASIFNENIQHFCVCYCSLRYSMNRISFAKCESQSGTNTARKNRKVDGKWNPLHHIMYGNRCA